MELRFNVIQSAQDKIFETLKSVLFLIVQVFIALPLMLALSLYLIAKDVITELWERGDRLSDVERHQSSKELNVLITGATSGIGRALAFEYARNARRGLNLVITGRNADELHKIAKELESDEHGIRVITSDSLDVTDRKAMRSFIEQVHRDLGHLDIVYANAGVNRLQVASSLMDKGIECTREALDRQLVDINLVGVMNTIYPALDVFERDLQSDPSAWKQLAITSSMSIHFNPVSDTYGACKSAVTDLGRSLRYELCASRKNIGVSVILPGWVESNMSKIYRQEKPFMISAEDAAKRIIRGVHRNHELVVFPLPLYIFTRAFQFIPHGLLGPFLKLSLGKSAKSLAEFIAESKKDQ